MISASLTLKEPVVKANFSRLSLLTCLAAGLAGVSACASMDEKTRSAAQTTNAIGNRVDASIRRGIASGNAAADNAVKAGSAPIDRAAKKIGLPGGPPTPSNTDRTGGGN